MEQLSKQPLAIMFSFKVSKVSKGSQSVVRGPSAQGSPNLLELEIHGSRLYSEAETRARTR